MGKYAVIVAGGSGSRMGADVPKQFIQISGKPVLMHTISRFFEFDNNIQIILVLPQYQTEYWKQLCDNYTFLIKHQIVEGGKTRFQSVKNGLNAIHTAGHVAIHDGVRPLIPIDVIRNSFETAIEKGNAVACVKLKDSIRYSENEGATKALDRNRFYLVQTPQTFEIGLIKRAFDTDESPEFTDEASVLEKFGVPINIVQGSYQNIKITTPEDLLIATAFLQ